MKNGSTNQQILRFLQSVNVIPVVTNVHDQPLSWARRNRHASFQVALNSTS